MDKKDKNPNVPNLRFKDFDNNWKVYKIDDITKSCGGGTPSTKNELYWNGNIPWISSSDLFDNDIRSININRYITKDALLNSSTKLCPKGTICIVSRVGVGKIAISECEICTSQDFMNIIDFKGNKYFLAQLLQNKIKSSQLQGTSIKGITTKEIKDLRLFIPCMKEQDKIMQFLYIIDEKINTQIKIIEDYEELKSWITDQIFNREVSTKKLKSLIFEVNQRNKLQLALDVLTVSNKRGFIKQSEQFEERNVASEDTSNYKIVCVDQYAYNPARINVGSIARLENYEKGIISPMYTCFELNEEKLNPVYFDLFLKSKSFKAQLNKKLEGSVRQCLIFSGMLSMDIPLPSIQIQSDIAKRISLLDSKIKIENDYLIRLKQQKQYLLDNMFI